ncbi:MAG: DUF86 domain-containing protein [Defluviitaleaceae bacterium]|nr:DUF86 domain-containing protein [Defluviitaleaceae bacterium]
MSGSDIKYLKNMLKFSEKIMHRIQNISLSQFLDDEEKQDLILYPLGQLGENANRVSEAFRDEYSEILWNPVIGVRNRVFHSYGDINMEVIYEIATENIPLLVKQLQRII